MRRFARLGLFVLGYAACQKTGDAEDVCDQARAHLVECELAEPVEMDCTEREECTAGCVTEASCSELDNPVPSGDYLDCLVDCEEKAEAGTRPCEEALERFESCGIN